MVPQDAALTKATSAAQVTTDGATPMPAAPPVAAAQFGTADDDTAHAAPDDSLRTQESPLLLMRRDTLPLVLSYLDLASVANISQVATVLQRRCKAPRYKINAMVQTVMQQRRLAKKVKRGGPVDDRPTGEHEYPWLITAKLVSCPTEQSRKEEFNMAQSEQQLCCSKALERCFRIAQIGEWSNLSSFAFSCAKVALKSQLAGVVDLIVNARMKLKDFQVDSDEESLSETSSQDGGLEVQGLDSGFRPLDIRFPTGEGEFVLNSEQFEYLLNASIEDHFTIGARMLLTAESDAPDSQKRLGLDGLRSAMISCARLNREDIIAGVMAILVVRDSQLVEPTMNTVIIEAAAASHANLARSMVRMTAARIARDRANADDAEEEEQRMLLANVARRSDSLQATMHSALGFAAKHNNTQVIQSLLDTPPGEKLDHNALKLVAKQAAMNGSQGVFLSLISLGKLTDDTLLSLFDECVRRGYETSVKTLLVARPQLFSWEILQALRKEAYLREHDGVVALLDAAVMKQGAASDETNL